MFHRLRDDNGRAILVFDGRSVGDEAQRSQGGLAGKNIFTIGGAFWLLTDALNVDFVERSLASSEE